MGGDGIYSCWKLSYLEPMFQDAKFLRREKFVTKENLAMYKPGLCPNAEATQPKLLQFKTNYWDFTKAEQQAEILRKTVRSW